MLILTLNFIAATVFEVYLTLSERYTLQWLGQNLASNTGIENSKFQCSGMLGFQEIGSPEIFQKSYMIAYLDEEFKLRVFKKLS